MAHDGSAIVYDLPRHFTCFKFNKFEKVNYGFRSAIWE